MELLKHSCLSILVILLLIASATPSYGHNVPILSDDNGYLTAVKDLPSGWTSETVYQTKPLGPISICEKNDNNVLILDRAAHEIQNLELNGTVTTYLSTGNLSFNAIAYQPNANRIIALGETAFYTNESEMFHVLQEHPPEITYSTCIVNPIDDSIYTAHWANGSTIYHFDSDGLLISSVLSDIQGCSQLAIDGERNLLYYTETFLGRITMINMTSNSTSILASGIAIPGTGEGIGIAVDPLGDLYYYVAEGVNKGFWKFNGTNFENIMNPIFGIGPITWSHKFDAVLCAAGFGACIVKYDPVGIKPERLTPTVNTRSIVETSEGLLLLGIDKTIYQVVGGIFSNFISNLPYPFSNILLDNNGNIYASLANDSPLILNIYPNGTYSTWFSGHIDGFPASLSYDAKNDMMILLTITGEPKHFDLWRIPLDNPDDYLKVTSFANVTNGACTVDRSGNIYVLERSSNIMYKIPDGSNNAQVLFDNVVEHAFLVGVNIVYSSVLDAVVLPRNDDLQAWPVSGSGSYLLAVNNIGIDNEGVFENADNELVCTHSGQIFRLVYSEPATSSVPTSSTTTSSTMSTTTSPTSSTEFPTNLLIMVVVGVVIIVFVIIFVIKRR